MDGISTPSRLACCWARWVGQVSACNEASHVWIESIEDSLVLEELVLRQAKVVVHAGLEREQPFVSLGFSGGHGLIHRQAVSLSFETSLRQNECYELKIQEQTAQEATQDGELALICTDEDRK